MIDIKFVAKDVPRIYSRLSFLVETVTQVISCIIIFFIKNKRYIFRWRRNRPANRMFHIYMMFHNGCFFRASLHRDEKKTRWNGHRISFFSVFGVYNLREAGNQSCVIRSDVLDITSILIVVRRSHFHMLRIIGPLNRRRCGVQKKSMNVVNSGGQSP